MAGAAVRYFNQ